MRVHCLTVAFTVLCLFGCGNRPPGAPAGTYEELFGETLVRASGESVSPLVLSGKKVGLYFSAHWCPPCRAFTPRLVRFYREVRRKGKPFEMVFVSLDRSAEAMATYMDEAEMPFLAVPYDSPKRRELIQRFQVNAIPRLIILGSDRSVLVSDARSQVQSLGEAAFDRW